MLLFGLEEHDAATFLKENRASLILAGVKIGNLPKDNRRRMLLITKFNGRSLTILTKWIFKNISTNDDYDELSTAISTLSKSILDESYDGISQKKLWRTILIGYSNPDTKAEVDNFLTQDQKELNDTSISSEDKERSKESNLPIVKLSAKEVPRLRGVTTKKPLSYSREILGDVGKLPVLGVCTNILTSGQFFIHIAGAILDDNLIEFSHNESLLLFPESGDATGFPNDYFDTSPPRDLLAIWGVKYQNTDRRTRYLIRDFQSNVYQVFKVPHPSTDPDHVRSWIQYQYSGRVYVYPVFELADGVIIKTLSDTTHFANYNFDTPFNAYKSLEVVAWQGKLIVIKPFPVAEFKYDCANINSAIKRLFKVRAEITNFPVLTKANLQDLAALASKEFDDGLITQSASRAINSIEHIFSIRENVDIFFEDLLSLPEVVKKINEEIEKVRFDQKSLIDSGRAELVQLDLSKKKLLNEIQAANQVVKNQASELAKEIKKAFERASKEGVKTLSDIAVFQSFLTPGLSSKSNKEVEKNTLDISNAKEITEFKELANSINLKAIQTGLSPNSLRIATSALISSGILGLTGGNTSQIISSIADVIAGGNLCSISISADMFSMGDLLKAPVSISSDRLVSLSLGQLLESYQNVSRSLIVELKGFNRFPPESVLDELLTLTDWNEQVRVLSWRSVSGEYSSLEIKAPIFFILTFSSGRSIFPIVGDQAYEIPLLDTGINWSDNMDPISGRVFPPTFILNSFLREIEKNYSNKKELKIDNLSLLSMEHIQELALTLQSLGESDEDANILSFLLFSIGRYDIKELLPFVDNSTSQLSGFIGDYFKNFNPKKTKYIFEI